MRLIFSILILFGWSIIVQAQPAARGPLSYESFFKKGMKRYEGLFPIYEHEGSYYLEIGGNALGQEVLILGDSPTASGAVAKSSACVRFVKSPKADGIQLVRIMGSDMVVDATGNGLQNLVDAANLAPISAVIPAVAEGKTAGSLIINLTATLLGGGELLNFPNVSRLSRPDQTRTMIDAVQADTQSSIFQIRWSQTEKNQATNTDIPTTNTVFLGFFQLDKTAMEPKIADSRFGFKTFQRVDYGRYTYYATSVNYIQKWDLGSTKTSRSTAKSKSNLLRPNKPIRVAIDRRIPSYYKGEVINGIKDWSEAFRSAGLESVLLIEECDLSNTMMTPQTILVRWDNASLNRTSAIVTDPLSGKIIAGKMNLGDVLIDELALDYFANCGLADRRQFKNIYDPQVRGDLMRYRTAQLMGEILGLLPNELASSAYSTTQLRDSKWMQDKGPTSSVMDLAFNYVAQKQDHLPTSALLPKVGVYDQMAIKWAYAPTNKSIDESMLSQDGQINPIYLYGVSETNSPWAIEQGLASDRLEAVRLGISNLQQLFPQLEKIVQKQPGLSNDWSEYLLLSNAVKRNYKRRVIQAASIIGGRGSLPVRVGYNDRRYRYPTAAEQREAMIFVGENISQGLPSWLNDTVAQRINGANSESYLQLQHVEVLKTLLNINVLDNILTAQTNMGGDCYTADELFQSLDHYIFLDFALDQPVSAYYRMLQFNYLNIVLQLAKSNKLEGGLTPARSLLGAYFNRITTQIEKLSKQHKDQISRDNYELMKIYLRNNDIKN